MVTRELDEAIFGFLRYIWIFILFLICLYVSFYLFDLFCRIQQFMGKFVIFFALVALFYYVETSLFTLIRNTTVSIYENGYENNFELTRDYLDGLAKTTGLKRKIKEFLLKIFDSFTD